MRVLAVPDKFRGTATAEQVCAAIADGGEGMLEAFGGPNRLTAVTGPGGGPVSAGPLVPNGSAASTAAPPHSSRSCSILRATNGA